jgi:hypothetical protein
MDFSYSNITKTLWQKNITQPSIIIEDITHFYLNSSHKKLLKINSSTICANTLYEICQLLTYYPTLSFIEKMTKT